MRIPNEDELLMLEVEAHMQRHKELRKEAEENIRGYGWTEKDDDFEIQIEQEIKRLWDEDMERELSKFYWRHPDMQ